MMDAELADLEGAVASVLQDYIDVVPDDLLDDLVMVFVERERSRSGEQ